MRNHPLNTRIKLLRSVDLTIEKNTAYRVLKEMIENESVLNNDTMKDGGIDEAIQEQVKHFTEAIIIDSLHWSSISSSKITTASTTALNIYFCIAAQCVELTSCRCTNISCIVLVALIVANKYTFFKAFALIALFLTHNWCLKVH